ncbi:MULTISPECIES: Trk system potassium transporter TrkA [Limibacillus]|jgi:trk system potassium uptake protein TrkA|uniref:Trk system potassium uptake protein TrkA n=1 Tax=Limibacillus halophilus TaxID=1579333 RepID=A0A839SY27_9PROT|nr:Trk system potassium transporter TrkA [Limibacillus halophilus]MBB3065925.1 trk system potassium uptake protein TrkA [Limibacillus halophilus]
MKVIICGAGQVGFNIARYLASEGADITVVDRDPDLVQKISDNLDVKGLVGFASYPEVLERAGARDADLVIAVTYADEVNMVACQICHSIFEVPTKIARVRNQSYLEPMWSDLFSSDHMPIDHIISPELEVARGIERRLQITGAFDAIALADGKVTLIGVRCSKETPILNTPLRQLTDLFPDLHIVIVGVQRGGKGFVPRPEDELREGDDVYFIADSDHLQRAMASFGHEERAARRVIIVGGGNIGLNLAQSFEEKHPHVNLKLIEVDKGRAEFVARTLESTVVIHGDALDSDILEEANVKATETLIAVSNDDEVNILCSLLAKQFGCQRAVTLVNKTSYGALVGSLGIDAIVSPRAITVSTILQHVRRGRIRSVHSLADGFGEVIEAEALETSGLVGIPLREARLPEGVLIGAIVRPPEVIIPRGDTVIKAHDRVVLFASAEAVKKVEKLFSVRLEFF